MSSSYSIAYLSTLHSAAIEFSEAFEAWMSTQTETWRMSGSSTLIAPVSPGRSASRSRVNDLEARLARAALSASAGVRVTGSYLDAGVHGLIDPIANWRYLQRPMAPFTPPYLRSTVAEVVSRLEAMIADQGRASESEVMPFSPADWHPVVWASASKQWTLHQYREAVAQGAEGLTQHWRGRLGRGDVHGTEFWQQTLNPATKPAPGRPQLRAQDPHGQVSGAQCEGLMRLGRIMQDLAVGLTLTVRNTAVHDSVELSEQEAMEMLSAYSMFARMLDQCEVRFADEPLPSESVVGGA